jgi:tripartite-type tricarboxylate transporter receptor subunit TctC
MKFARFVLAAALPLIASVPAWGQAPAFPSKPVHLVVGFTPGGATDATARKLGQALVEELGQQVVIENRPGASGNIGADYVAKAAPDGHTLLFAPSTLIANPLVSKAKPLFDLQKDLTPIGMVASGPLLLLVPVNGPSTVKEFVERARANPGKTNFGTGGFGAAGHLSAELFKIRAGLPDVPVILYKGTAPAVTDLIGGQLSAMMEPTLSAMPQVRGGKLKAVAISADKRDPLFPDVPTFAEAGFPDMSFSTWYGVWGPANLPPAVRTRLETAQTRVLNSPEFKTWLAQQGYEPSGLTGAGFTNFLSRETERYARIVRDGKIEAQ